MNKYSKYLLAILLLGLLLRLLYVYVFFDILFPFGNNHFTGDSFSYFDSIINLIKHGSYCFDLKVPDSAFGRLPGYPFFIGLHYLILGENNYIEGVIFSQILIDTIAIYLVYAIINKITANQRSGLIGAFLYATFPFVVAWPATISTESIACFSILLWLYYLVYKTDSRYYIIGAGLICAICFFIRSYMGILTPITFIYFALIHAPTKGKTRPVIIFTIGFLLLYMWWPIRNYVYHDRVILIKPSTAGYINMTSDVYEYINFYHCFSNDDNKWIEILQSNKTDVFPSAAFDSPSDKKLANDLLVMARQCGSGFRTLRKIYTYPNEANCNDTIAKGYHYLTMKYIATNPIKYFIVVPLQNLRKAFFKSEVESEIIIESSYIKLCFYYRSALIIIGFVALFVLRKNKYVIIMGIYILFMYGYICFYFRSLEMRYLIQADVLLLICASLLIHLYIMKWESKKTLSGTQIKKPVE